MDRYVYAPWGSKVAAFDYFHDAEEYARWRSAQKPGSKWTVEGYVTGYGLARTTFCNGRSVLDEIVAAAA